MTTRAATRARFVGFTVIASLVIAVAWLRIGVPASAGEGNVVVPPGVVFEDPPVAPHVPVDVAINVAGGRRPDAWAYVLMTNPNVGPGLIPGLGPDGMVRRPMYVLEYENVEVPLYGPSVEASSKTVTGTTQVYVDAETGAPLYARNEAVNRPDFDGDSTAWRIMESWQNTAAPAARSSGGIRPNSGSGPSGWSSRRPPSEVSASVR